MWNIWPNKELLPSRIVDGALIPADILGITGRRDRFAVAYIWREKQGYFYDRQNADLGWQRRSDTDPITLAQKGARRQSKEQEVNHQDKIVFVNGAFDVLHVGHVNLLQFAATCGGTVIVALNDDESVRRLKGSNRPVNSLRDRQLLLEAFDFVSHVYSFAEDNPLFLLRRMRAHKKIIPHVYVKGSDYRARVESLPEISYIRETKAEIIFYDKTQHSTSDMLRRARAS